MMLLKIYARQFMLLKIHARQFVNDLNMKLENCQFYLTLIPRGPVFTIFSKWMNLRRGCTWLVWNGHLNIYSFLVSYKHMTCLSSVAVEKAYFSEQPHIFFLPPPLSLLHTYLSICTLEHAVIPILSTNLLEYFTWTDLPACTICTYGKLGRQTRDLV